MTELVKTFKELDDFKDAEEAIQTALMVSSNPSEKETLNKKLNEIQSLVVKLKSDIDEKLAVMRDTKQSITLKDAVDIINISNNGVAALDRIVYILDETSSKVTVDIAELLLKFSLTVPSDEDIYKDLIYILSRTIDGVTNSSHLTDIAISM